MAGKRIRGESLTPDELYLVLQVLIEKGVCEVPYNGDLKIDAVKEINSHGLFRDRVIPFTVVDVNIKVNTMLEKFEANFTSETVNLSGSNWTPVERCLRQISEMKEKRKLEVIQKKDEAKTNKAKKSRLELEHGIGEETSSEVSSQV
jgi:hypothetical protein